MTVIALSDEAHMARVRERLAENEVRFANGYSPLRSPVAMDDVMRFGRLASDARTAAKRVFWLRQMCAVAERTVAPAAACKAGCDHCCHIDVAVSRPEALLIAREAGVQLHEPVSPRTPEQLLDALSREVEPPQHAGSPCPFLANSRCSIYQWRPLACRLHFNLDRDDLLCRLVEGFAVSVPYFNSIVPKAIAMQVLGTTSEYADIREWFVNTTPSADS